MHYITNNQVVSSVGGQNEKGFFELLLWKVKKQIMYREIKFKAKGQTDRKWYYGLLVYINGTICHIKDFKDKTWICDSNTLGQFTGRKDINEKELYEDDIFETNVEKYITRYQIDWDETYGWFARDAFGNGDGDMPLCEFTMSDIHIIGNIFDNPELIKLRIEATKFIAADCKE